MRRWIVCAAVAGAACAAGSGEIPKASPPQGDYQIGREDVLEVVVWHEPELSRVVPVRPDGKISLPIVGEIEAAGRTPVELRNTISESLARYVRDVQVGVLVREVNNPKVYVMGEVHKPGVFPLRGGLSVVQALALAGGVDEFAGNEVVWLRQRPDGKAERISLSYGQLVKGEVKGALWLAAGDVIYVP
jgi:polysaccharide export outer membrane protein